MLQETLQTTLIDEQRVAELKDDSTPDDNLFADMVDLFESSVKKSLETLATALAQQDKNAMRVTAHKIRNTSGNVGATRMHALATQFEMQCEKFDGTHSQEWFQQMTTTYDTSLVSLRAHV